MHSSKNIVWRQTMFSAKHFDKHFCLSLGNTGLLIYKNPFRQWNNPAIIRQFLNPAIAGLFPE
jgi:hypothetical protein